MKLKNINQNNLFKKNKWRNKSLNKKLWNKFWSPLTQLQIREIFIFKKLKKLNLTYYLYIYNKNVYHLFRITYFTIKPNLTINTRQILIDSKTHRNKSIRFLK